MSVNPDPGPLFPGGRRAEHALGFHAADLSDFEFNLTVSGAPFSMKRGKIIVYFGKGLKRRASIGLSSAAKQYFRLATQQLRAQWSTVFTEPIPKHVELNAAIVSYLPNRRLIDASNLYQGVEDAMNACGPRCKPQCYKHAGVYVDDVQIRTHNGSDRMIDRDNPRVEIQLTPYKPRSTR